MFRKIGDALRRFMAGRYGTDKLNQWLLGLAIVLIVLGLIGSRTGSAILAVLGTVAYVPLIWSLFRMYSRNIEARRRENAAFQRVLTQLKDRDHRYYHCPKCRQTVRVPRGRGKINNDPLVTYSRYESSFPLHIHIPFRTVTMQRSYLRPASG